MSKVDEVLAALQKIDTLKTDAIQELLASREKIDEQLEKLGHVEKAKKKPQHTVDPNKPCPVCDFITVPAHDARTHRNQPEKKPFTAKELADKGYKKK